MVECRTAIEATTITLGVSVIFIGTKHLLAENNAISARSTICLASDNS